VGKGLQTRALHLPGVVPLLIGESAIHIGSGRVLGHEALAMKGSFAEHWQLPRTGPAYGAPGGSYRLAPWASAEENFQIACGELRKSGLFL